MYIIKEFKVVLEPCVGVVVTTFTFLIYEERRIPIPS